MCRSQRQQGLHHVLEHDAGGMRAGEREGARGLPGDAACEIRDDEVRQARDEEGEEEAQVAGDESPSAGAWNVGGKEESCAGEGEAEGFVPPNTTRYATPS
jgi:hypothetical protein